MNKFDIDLSNRTAGVTVTFRNVPGVTVGAAVDAALAHLQKPTHWHCIGTDTADNRDPLADADAPE